MTAQSPDFAPAGGVTSSFTVPAAPPLSAMGSAPHALPKVPCFGLEMLTVAFAIAALDPFTDAVTSHHGASEPVLHPTSGTSDLPIGAMVLHPFPDAADVA